MNNLKDIKAYQGYESIPAFKFGFNKQYRLNAYMHRTQPLVVFGCYKAQDYAVINNHKGLVIVVWMGSDSLNVNRKLFTKKEIIHVSTLPCIKEQLKRKRIKCHLINIVARHRPMPLAKGDKVYTYLNRSKPEYHGKKLVDKIYTNFELLVGDGSITTRLWKQQANSIYGQSFIGLFLSEFAGGFISIQEMGLRGIPVVTNLANLPHTIPFDNIYDIEQAIQQKSIGIGEKDEVLSEQVYESMVKNVRCFNLGKLLKDEL